MSEETEPKVKTKQSFREQIWIQMAKGELTNSVRSLCNRIPYFKGAAEATQRLSELNEFKQAKLLMISPDKPQESVIILSLQKEKEILIPRPRLLTGLFCHVKNANGLPEEEKKNAISRHGIKQIEKSIGFDTLDLKVDMLVLGSVCVSKTGQRIGDGEGFADLEYAILSKMKAVNENTLIVTTVHDCQVVDEFPDIIFGAHDLPVDVIVTPTQTIFVDPKLTKPTEIIWSEISQRRITAIPVLNDVKKFDENQGKTLALKETDTDVESRNKEKIRVKKAVLHLRPKLQRKKSISDVVSKENEKTKEPRRKPFIRRKRLQKSKENHDSNELKEKPTVDKPAEKLKPQRQRSSIARHHIDFSLRLSNIASTVRVRDLKSALLERGVKPSNITWRGQRGFCVLHFGKLRKKNNVENQQPVQVDSIVANLQQLKIGESEPASENGFITVEPAEPVTRIEVTDVTAV